MSRGTTRNFLKTLSLRQRSFSVDIRGFILIAFEESDSTLRKLVDFVSLYFEVDIASWKIENREGGSFDNIIPFDIFATN